MVDFNREKIEKEENYTTLKSMAREMENELGDVTFNKSSAKETLRADMLKVFDTRYTDDDEYDKKSEPDTTEEKYDTDTSEPDEEDAEPDDEDTYDVEEETPVRVPVKRTKRSAHSHRMEIWFS